jgi:fucose permease
MKQLNKWQNAVLLCGGLLMVVGAGISLLSMTAAPYVYSLGAIGFASMQLSQRYEGKDMTLRRLRRIMILSDLLFLVSGVFMFASQGNTLGLSHITYLQYVYNKWVGILLLAAILQIYVSHRIDYELKKNLPQR